MEANDDDFSAIAWPGFVDILSTVIMMFLFFVMIVSIVMYSMSMDFKKTVQAESEKEVKERVSEEVQRYAEKFKESNLTPDSIKTLYEYEQEVEKLTEENAELQKKIEELKTAPTTGIVAQAGAGMAAAGTEQTTEASKDSFTILFDDNAISLSESTIDAVKAFAKAAIGSNKKLRVTIMAGDNPNAATVSIAREMGLARALNVRNVFLLAEVPSANISVKYIDAEKFKDSYNWIRIKVEGNE